MPKINAPRKGSMQFSPRKRAKRIYPRVSTWPNSEKTILMGFAGYKAGMTHTFVFDPKKDTPTANQEVFTPVTVLECPPIMPFAIRFYKKTPYGLFSAGEVWTEKISDFVSRKIPIPKKPVNKPVNDADFLSVLVHTNPNSISFKKTPEIFEIPVSGKTFDEKLNYANQILGKELKVSELFKGGDFVDVTAITKGKGVQGPVKRFGIRSQSRKHSRTGKGRHVGSLGGRRTATRPTVPQAGQMGYQKRTEFNKLIIKIGAKGEDITPKGGFLNYGIVSGDFVLVKGSVPGPVKRLVRFRHALRAPAIKPVKPNITYISLESKQAK